MFSAGWTRQTASWVLGSAWNYEPGDKIELQNQQFINIKQDTEKKKQSSRWRSGKISYSAGFRSMDRTPNPLWQDGCNI